MKSKISQLAVAALFSLAAVSANAATYNFWDSFDLVSHQENVPQGDHWSDYLNFNYRNGESALSYPANYPSSIALGTTHWWQGSTSYSFTLTTTTGEQLFGNYTYISQSSNGDNRSYAADMIFTGGTGVFSGATGTGTFNGEHNIASWTGYLTSQSSISVAAVPEADTSAMLLIGAGVMGFMARRRKQVAA